MNQRIVASRQSFCLVVLFALGSAAIMVPGREAGRDLWMAVLVALALSAPLALLYGRLVQLTGTGNMIDLILDTLGPVFGRIVLGIYTVYSIHLGALVLRNFTEYIQLVSFPYQPQYLFALPFGALCIWSVRAEISTLKRISVYLLPAVTVLLLIMIGFSGSLFDLRNLTPMLYNGFKPVLNGATQIVAFPFMETVLVCFLIRKQTNKKSARSIFFWAFVYAAVLMALLAIRNTIILSYEQATKFMFPAYLTTSLINIGDFIQGIQALQLLLFIFGGFVKIAVCLYVASESVGLFCRQRYRSVAAPIGLLMAAFSLFVSKDAMDMVQFGTTYYKFYVLPTGLILPVILWVAAEIRHRAKEKAGAAPAGENAVPQDPPTPAPPPPQQQQPQQ